MLSDHDRLRHEQEAQAIHQRARHHGLDLSDDDRARLRELGELLDGGPTLEPAAAPVTTDAAPLTTHDSPLTPPDE
jgi:hypothetical protein